MKSPSQANLSSTFGSSLALVTLTFIGLASASVTAHAQLLVSEDFDGSGSDFLDGKTTTTGGLTWQVVLQQTGYPQGTLFRQDGTVLESTDSINVAFLPYTFEVDKVYDLRATITSPGTNWISLGFSTSDNINHSSAADGGYPWVLARTHASNDDVVFWNGPGTAGDTVGTDSDTDGTYDVSIQLDLTGTIAQASYFLNGIQLGSTQDLGITSTALVGDLPGFGFTRFSGSGGNGSIENMSLSVVPEPSNLALLAGAFGLLAALRRRRT
ncbi:PEP-CTERM sorting domain-containing protein [Puniceicoccus vermicola]|nr:PEP-CTERM sorting domain-containing protein [Puniceicoccus vermicola]